ncbi:hypothetical protein N7468_008847 [Penicillium chermesinum]|uniref:DUF7136 domain-containing protein n=1 Tax=Penicillium chermesinum TaxID=63820 RepID=A0A9W9NH47_9EURO|nr:uncharacterized protein N7468_008847 [Penicillium chermesinum]KAJ5219643.1 hypothetical protein N7468_008847 [Penicillium chermesinum]
MGTIINASNILEVDLIFPRNETYAPAELFPIIFAIQNPERARYLTPELTYVHGFESDPETAYMISNYSTRSTSFTLQSSAPKVDLVAGTAKETCPTEYGITINVTDKLMQVPLEVSWTWGSYTNNTCAVVASSGPTPTSDPCRVNIDKTIAASMEASLHTSLCNSLDPPSYCVDDKESAAQQVAVAGISCLLAAIGAFWFFLV